MEGCLKRQHAPLGEPALKGGKSGFKGLILDFHGKIVLKLSWQCYVCHDCFLVAMGMGGNRVI